MTAEGPLLGDVGSTVSGPAAVVLAGGSAKV
jgi:hypothetical protein